MEGNIASGKTTFLEYFKQYPDTEVQLGRVFSADVFVFVFCFFFVNLCQLVQNCAVFFWVRTSYDFEISKVHSNWNEEVESALQ